LIYTITLNPALDRTLWVETIREDVPNRIEREYSYTGGKSIDVSRVLTNFGAENCALGFVGGFAGDELEGKLINDGIRCDFTRVSGETRTNIIIHEQTTRKQLLFSAKGPQIKSHELMQMIRKIEGLKDMKILSLGGSLPPGLNSEIYRKLVTLAKSRGAKVILDVDGLSLRVGVQGQPDVIKPNVHELSQMVGRELVSMEEILQTAKNIHNGGVEIVLVSMGAKGILLVSGDQAYHAVPPKVEVKNTVGAGDSSVAGFIFGMVRGEDLKRSLIYAVAAGTATTLQPGTALCDKEAFTNLLPTVELRVL
jgi:6-phosphofructokinase 2